MIISRTPWPPGFPEVVVHSDQKARDNDPDFAAAKAGDVRAAHAMALRLIDPVKLEQPPFGRAPAGILLAVAALERTGYNAIPEAMVDVMAIQAWMPWQPDTVFQSNKVVHTKASEWHRLVTPARFEGPIQAGGNYVLVDDHVGFGGTLANLRGHVEMNGGRVIGMTTLSKMREAEVIAVRPETLDMLWSAHGEVLRHFWEDHFGHGLDCLTNIEAGFLARQQSFDAIRDGLVEAAERARAEGLSAVAVKTRR